MVLAKKKKRPLVVLHGLHFAQLLLLGVYVRGMMLFLIQHLLTSFHSKHLPIGLESEREIYEKVTTKEVELKRALWKCKID